TAGGPGALQNSVGANLSPNGRPPTTLPEPIKRARDQDLRGFAGEGNVAERSERMRAKRSPTSPRIKSEERGWACYVHVRIVQNNHLHAERPEGEEWACK